MIDKFGLMVIERMPENIIKNIHEQVMTLPFLPSFCLPVAVLSVFCPLTVFFEWQSKPTEPRSECPSNLTPSVDCVFVFSDHWSAQQPLLMYVCSRLDTSEAASIWEMSDSTGTYS